MRVRHFIVNILLAAVWAIFMYINLSAYFISGRVTLLLFVLAQTEFIVLLLARKDPIAITKKWDDYVVALVGTFVVLLFQPSVALLTDTAPTTMTHVGDALIYLGVLLEIIGYISLNRSAGIVAANRGVKTEGLYTFVRHPIYASYLLIYIGYVLGNPSLFNWCVLFLAIVFQGARIQREEEILRQDPAYVEYASNVKWRLIPFVY